ncbi:hypothetical protein [Nocardioides jejuensis]|nr:hypothetical protein [Nocardioides jejuensis]
MSRQHHRPMFPGDRFFEAIERGVDPAAVTEAAEVAAAVLVRGARAAGDEVTAQRVLTLADTEGMETLAELWSHAPAHTLAGCLWRLYLLRGWVHTAPLSAAEEYDAGHRVAEVARVVAGVEEPPGPDEVRLMVDDVLRGIVRTDFADVLLRAAAFARVVAVGRAALGRGNDTAILTLSEQLEAAAHAELDHGLG